MATAEEYKGSEEFYLVLKECVVAAEHHGVVTYEQVAQYLPHVPSTGTFMTSDMDAMAGAVSEEMVENGHPMLGALIVDPSDLEPSDGFYDRAHELGVLERDPESMLDSERREFWKGLKDEVYEYWG